MGVGGVSLQVAARRMKRTRNRTLWCIFVVLGLAVPRLTDGAGALRLRFGADTEGQGEAGNEFSTRTRRSRWRE